MSVHEEDLSVEAREWLKDYADCNLEDLILREIETAAKVIAKRGFSVEKQNALIAMGLKKCVRQAKGLAQRNKRDICYYLTMSVSPGNRWLYNFVVSGGM